MPSLQSTIYIYRPDLFEKEPIGDAIPLLPPKRFAQYTNKKRNLISSSFMLATDWNTEDDPTGW